MRLRAGRVAETVRLFLDSDRRLVCRGCRRGCGPGALDDQDDLAAGLAEVCQRLGLTRAQASALLESRYGLTRRRAYQLWLGKT